MVEKETTSICDLISGGSKPTEALLGLFSKTTKKPAKSPEDVDEGGEKRGKKRKKILENAEEMDNEKPEKLKKKKEEDGEAGNEEETENVIPKETKIEKKKKAKKEKKEKAKADLTPEEEKFELRKADRMAQVEYEDKKEKKLDPEKEARTVFVGNLPTTFQKSNLKSLFTGYGKIETVRFRGAGRPDLKTTKKAAVITRNFHEDRDNINGYVRFSTVAEATNACAVNGKVVDSHKIRVDMAVRTEKHDNKLAIFLGNLDFNCKEDDIVKVFEKCGDIVAIRIIRDSATGIGKGIGYVNFGSIHAVDMAMRLNKVDVNGRKIRVGRAVRKPKAGKIVGAQQKKKPSIFPKGKANAFKKEFDFKKKFDDKKKKKFDKKKSTNSFQGETGDSSSNTKADKRPKFDKKKAFLASKLSNKKETLVA